MEVVAFVGSSGTGKSHRALVVAHENKIECIIDDGILIHDNKIVAGFSAKKESSRLKAVRRAIFQDEVQVKSVREQLDKIKPNKLMIIGTSDNMVKKITKALGLQEPDRYIRIEDVATPKEIEKAQHARLKEGKHIIPVPTMELKPHFRGYLIDPIKTMWRRRTLKKQDQDTLGQIGSELVYRLRQEKGLENVLATDIRKPEGHPVVEEGLFEVLDVLDEEKMLTLATEFEADTMIHLASLLSSLGL